MFVRPTFPLGGVEIGLPVDDSDKGHIAGLEFFDPTGKGVDKFL